MNPLLEELDTSSDKKAEKVIRRIVRRGKGLVPELLVAAKDLSRPRIRKWALQALRDEQWYVRQAAAQLCAELKLWQLKKVLVVLAASDSRKAVRVAAVTALEVLS
mgnify:CR=1 FL=1